nr:4-(cytidine 5'-diphospho)-2-C-methyl-D-erythritol kinase [Mangrovicoccus algicola]
MQPIAKATEAAPAKINLALHVTGRRGDGYHLLDSLVAFADIADRVTVEPAAEMSLDVTGPRAAGVPADARNLVWKAAALSGAPPVAITLEKHLPAAAGIGGGSSDAAATLRALERLGLASLPDPADLLELGADLPVCLSPRAVRMEGIGETLSPVPPLPPLWCLLVNPGVALSTPAVFAALETRENPGLRGHMPVGAGAFCAWLAGQRNDLEPPALRLAPVIRDVLAALAAQPGCALARMSGSGATCFGLFPAEAPARAAAAALSRAEPGWWVAAGRLA